MLPVATVTTATILTTSLISSGKVDLDKKKENEDQELNDFVKPPEDFEDEKIFYSKEGDSDNLRTLDKDTAKKIEELMQKNGGKLEKGEQLGDTVQAPNPEINPNVPENQPQNVGKADSPEITSKAEDKDMTSVPKGNNKDEGDTISETKDTLISTSESTDDDFTNGRDDPQQPSLDDDKKDSDVNETPPLDTEENDLNKGKEGPEIRDDKSQNEGIGDVNSVVQKTLEPQSSTEENGVETNDDTSVDPVTNPEMKNEVGEATHQDVSMEAKGDLGKGPNFDTSKESGDSKGLDGGNDDQISDGNSDRYSEEAIKRLEQMQGELSEFELRLKQLID
ncbi:hypothetical protein A6V39_03290 [Candidatus Mycoplasma haematobovis]|uniref:Uncharacterized protein n=1 Tax=Candidatus Mycoplasma haematobovis TaxID=432608 RepID=A0A1A9QDY2_9MOLU|nr:hypothetical protein A6V39_03290 [Candidatus Mycoplasma haematobovis]